MKYIKYNLIVLLLVLWITQDVFSNQENLVIARFDDGLITRDEFHSVIDSLPAYKQFITKDLTESEWKTEIIHDLVARYYLVKEARAYSLDTLPFYKESIRRKTGELYWQHYYQEEIESKTEVSDNEIVQYYNSNQDLFQMPSLVVGRHIFFNLTKATTQSQKDRIRQKAETVLGKAKQGNDFIELARTYSDSMVEDKAKIIGPFSVTNANINIVVRTTLFAMEPGEISGLTITPFGYEILKLERKIPSWRITLDAAKKEIREIIKTEKRNTRIREFNSQLLEKYQVRSYPENFESDSTAVLLQMEVPEEIPGIENRIIKLTLGDLARQNDLSRIPAGQRNSILKQIALSQATRYEIQIKNYVEDTKITGQLEEIEKTLLSQQMIEYRLTQMEKKLQVTDAEIKDFYNLSNPDQERYSLLHDQVKIRSISILPESSESFDNPLNRFFVMDQLKYKAQQAHAQLISGRDFKEVASEYSADTTNAPGQESDFFDIDSYPMLKLGQLKIGEISQPVEIGKGFLIIQLVDRRKQPIQSLKERKDWIEDFLKKDKIRKARNDILASIVKKSGLKISREELNSDPFMEIR